MPSPPPVAFAHRGGALLPANVGIENTLAAFANAVDLGYTHLETDVHASRDGVVYAFHDASLARMTGRPARFADLDAADVDRLLVGGREPIPRLRDVLESFPGCVLSIDVKANRAVDATITEVRRHAAFERVIIGSFDHDRIRRLRAGLPGVTSALSRREVAGLMAGAPVPDGTCASVPVAYRGIRCITPRFIRRAHRRRVPVYAWTIDDMIEAAMLLDLGVDGIISDRIDDLRSLLIARGAWLP